MNGARVSPCKVSSNSSVRFQSTLHRLLLTVLGDFAGFEDLNDFPLKNRVEGYLEIDECRHDIWAPLVFVSGPGYGF